MHISVSIKLLHCVGAFVDERHYKAIVSMAPINRILKCVMFTMMLSDHVFAYNN